MRRIALLGIPPAIAAAMAVALFDGSSSPRAAAPACDPSATALAIDGPRRGDPGRVVRLDPRTLAERSRGVRLRGGHWAFDIAPHRPALAIGLGRARLQVIDLARERTINMLSLARRGAVREVAWTRSGRLVALVDPGDGASVVIADPERGRVLRRYRVAGFPRQSAETPDGLAVILSPRERIGRARLQLVDDGGQMRTVVLERIAAGFVPPDDDLAPGQVPLARHRDPGLAVAPDGSRAVVVAAGSPLVADVDLDTGRVEYHELSRPRSLAGRLHDWLVPPARAKLSEGSRRNARWLPNGLIAVSGDQEDSDPRTPFTAHGLRLIDPGDWSERTIDPDADWFQLAGGALVVWRPVGEPALRAYELDGSRRFQLPLARRDVFVSMSGCFLYTGRPRRTRVIDLRSGRTVRTIRRGPAPALLAE